MPGMLRPSFLNLHCRIFSLIMLAALGCTMTLKPSVVSGASPSGRSSGTRSGARIFSIQLTTNLHATPTVPIMRRGRSREQRHTRSFQNTLQAQKTSGGPEKKDLDILIAASKAERLAHLESQAMQALKYTVENYEHPVFTCALIAGDMVILELLHRMDYLSTGKVQVMFVDTFYLFGETIEFMRETEERYDFKANWFHAKEFNNKAELEAAHGVDFWKEDLKLYDSICKVEPYWRGLETLQADAVINGRRRDHGFDRAFLDLYEHESGADKINPLAYFTFEDVWDYIKAENVAYHPLHDKGYPSIGDAKDTVPVPKSRWFEYAGERLGRFNGLTNDDGSTKTECGIHFPQTEEENEDVEKVGSSDEKKGGGLTIEVM
uniref:Phosphoadenosine phosphosulphate reductase domain-containing protein n=1 Tax=Lotharella globosa TaxID=91324 RepID=A0A7S4DY49_9EUKA|mmetsp:Transcript_12684/g.23997  ORF Transcript_12684/g.23997 Transcript_12684/m.23997 type:complete len:378 (+) Transcript_12684:107-1240(+)